MTEHKWIIVDDREQIAERLKLSLEQWWKHLFGEELNVAVSTDPDEGIQQVMDNDFDVAIIDILFPSPLTDGPSTDSPPQTARGLDVIRVARDEDVSLIVGISRGDTINHPRIEEQALENGVNLFYYKSEIEKPGFAERFCKDIDVKLKPRKHGSGQRLLNYDKEDPRVAWPVEQIGIDTVCDLYEQSTRGQFQLRTGELFHVSRGYSGAIVLGIKGLTVDDVPIEHILKIDRNGKRIREELIRNPQGKRYRTDLALSYLVDRTYEPQPVQGWYAIAAPFYHGGETLQSWLSKEPSADSVNTILRAVFEDRGLDSGYSDLGQTTTETHQAETPLALMMPGDYSRAGILSGIDELSDAIMQIPPRESAKSGMLTCSDVSFLLAR